jgi:hypothetical protein
MDPQRWTPIATETSFRNYPPVNLSLKERLFLPKSKLLRRWSWLFHPQGRWNRPKW